MKPEEADQLTLMVVGKEAVLSLLNTVSNLNSAFVLHASCFYMPGFIASILDSPHAIIMQADAGAKTKEGIFALLWNRGSEHFQVLLPVPFPLIPVPFPLNQFHFHL